MAIENRPASDHLSLLRSAMSRAREYNSLALLRRAEARAGDLPRIGRSRLPSQNVVDLAHEPDLAFPASTVSDIEPGGRGRMRVRTRFLGLTGPMGALPIHLTEYAFYERRTSEKRPFGRFLDLLTDRMLQFFYRAWADSQPAAQADRPKDDRFAAYLGAISGLGMATRPRLEGTALSWQEYLRYTGLLVSRRSAVAIQDGVSHALGTPVRITEFVPRWRDIERRERTRLGGHGFSQLGVDAVLGARVCVVEDTFRVAIEARDAKDYESFLPGRPRHRMAREMLDVLKPSQLDWELQLELNERDAPPARLDGTTAVGLMSWLAPRARPTRRADARIRSG